MMQEATNVRKRIFEEKKFNKIWVANVPFSLEIVQEFIHTAEDIRKKYPQALVTILIAARNRSTPEIFGKDFPIDHVWFADTVIQAYALALAPTFYKLKTHSLGNHGNIPIQREDAIDALDCDLESHREILRLVLEGIF